MPDTNSDTERSSPIPGLLSSLPRPDSSLRAPVGVKEPCPHGPTPLCTGSYLAHPSVLFLLFQAHPMTKQAVKIPPGMHIDKFGRAGVRRQWDRVCIVARVHVW
jgi:hypothetical protein